MAYQGENVFTSPSPRVTLGSGQTFSHSVRFGVGRWWPRGLYTVTLTAMDATGSTSAQATLTVS